ncbi:MAG: inorganic phosphate transporter, partial [Proteobacteria bacterium]|nr:inorganic phosphate transporter [Pseudomonadota bacterium]
MAAALLVVVGATFYAMINVAGFPNAPVVLLASVVGVYMAMNIGANDVANNMGAAVGSGALKMTSAIVIAAVFEAAGALIGGGDVVDTISKGIIDPAAFSDSGQFIRLMLAALLAAAVWINLATWVGAPVSTTHSIVGGVLGAGLAAAGMSSANWPVMGKIAASWVISPLLGAIVAAVFLAAIKAAIVYRQDRVTAAKKWVPVLVGILGAAFAAYLSIKGLKHVWRPDMATISLVSLVTFGLIHAIVRPMVAASAKTMENTRQDVSRLFTIPLICAVALLCFAHGSNDVANAIGPLAAIVHSSSESGIAVKVNIPHWVMLLGALGLTAGLGIYGAKMVRKVGYEITEIDRIRAFAVALSSSITVIFASALALPVSSTH